ncbi:hypothetical protein HVTV-2_gp148 [Haloarcula virus HVTV-2]|uniref:Uncharacterized protein n=1 Tax=Haloarcula vallismortis tailed virus 1 TaxID=1262528 RepID=L7TKK5_9CAUD|nr:hypothetical protein HVTV1_146 [Haloarcula vallismortis tailed virus 1]AGC34515.1 hypothetical protein HVTV1_146 [Haloarcula vallismortis tailed virus 1]UBF22955.1 hypothetical protein HVTV-2_gp148 [Haloarcula virus HVTV-2]
MIRGGRREMEYETPDVGSMVRYEYDQDPESEYGVARGRGEVMGALDEVVDVDDNGRTVKIDLEAEMVTIIRERPRGDTDEYEYPLTSFKQEEVSDHLIREDDLYDNAEKYTDELDDVQGAIARANAAIGVVHRESDADFISQYDAWKAADVYENGIQQRLDAHNESDYGVSDRATIVFPSDALAYIWVEEICGQISDGAWENQVRDWEQYYGAKVEVDEDLRNVRVDGDLPTLDFRGELMKYEGLAGRMMFYVVASGVNEDLTRADLDELITMRLQNGFADSRVKA